MKRGERYFGKGFAKKESFNQMLYVDTKTSLPDDLLLKADKMTMANSIELRAPFSTTNCSSSRRLCLRISRSEALRRNILPRKTLRDRLPKEILERKKAGFPVPFGAWLKGELKDLVHDLLLDRESIARGYFNRNCVENLISDHSKSGGYPKEILSLMSLELWHRVFLGGKNVPPNSQGHPSPVSVEK